MDQRLSAHRQLAAEQVRVSVAGQQGALEKQHAGRPYAGAAAEPGEDEFRHQRLNLKQQERAQENSQCIPAHGDSLPCREIRVVSSDFIIEPLKVGRDSASPSHTIEECRPVSCGPSTIPSSAGRRWLCG